MHEPWDENYLRGYEWWIMTEAKKVFPYFMLCSNLSWLVMVNLLKELIILFVIFSV